MKIIFYFNEAYTEQILITVFLCRKTFPPSLVFSVLAIVLGALVAARYNSTRTHTNHSHMTDTHVNQHVCFQLGPVLQCRRIHLCSAERRLHGRQRRLHQEKTRNGGTLLGHFCENSINKVTITLF